MVDTGVPDPTLDEVLAPPFISGPLTRLQCCPVGEGAAAVIVALVAGAVAVVTITPLAALVIRSVSTPAGWSLAAWRHLGSVNVRPGISLGVDPLASIGPYHLAADGETVCLAEWFGDRLLCPHRLRRRPGGDDRPRHPVPHVAGVDRAPGDRDHHRDTHDSS